MINIRIDSQMKEVVQKVAENQHISMSAFIKQAIEEKLQNQGIDWRKEGDKKPKK